jgi:putative membrane protein
VNVKTGNLHHATWYPSVPKRKSRQQHSVWKKIPQSGKSLTEAEKHNKDKFSEIAEKDAHFLVNAYSNGIYRLKASEIAQNKARNSSTRQLADKLIQTETKTNNEIKAMASIKQISLPTDLTKDQQKNLQRLIEKRGYNFDEDYVKLMANVQQDDIFMFEKTIKESGDNDIRNWADKTLLILREHLNIANSDKETLKK